MKTTSISPSPLSLDDYCALTHEPVRAATATRIRTVTPLGEKVEALIHPSLADAGIEAIRMAALVALIVTDDTGDYDRVLASCIATGGPLEFG